MPGGRGLAPGYKIILAGPPTVGKSALALQMTTAVLDENPEAATSLSLLLLSVSLVVLIALRNRWAVRP